ncbi:uncharacterized protein C6orf118-like [Acanthaster planci]|uniref:Uncharacterized protein C6orf118-like n=1 Tax=Acanthaster planci TaxID=133434 RepID=A0A8B7XMG3_ACAPL|nr:uncharacterized protein C6orf118-like [Acanthaster planci]
MAEKVSERPLHDVLEGLFLDQKKDIDLLTRGHLNHNRLWKPPEKASHVPWESSGKEVPLMHKPSQLPSPRKSTDHHVQMTDAMYNFGVGTSGSIPVSQKGKTGKKSKDSRPRRKSPSPILSVLKAKPEKPLSTEQRPNTAASYISDNVYVEELRLPELMLPGASSVPRPKSPLRTGSPKSLAPLEADPRKGSSHPPPAFYESHLSGVTKKEQFQRFLDFQNNVMKKPEMNQRDVLSGRKAVEGLERKLQEDLMKLDEVHRLSGPNFPRLQVYSNIWDELIKATPEFGEMLSYIKDGYEEYMGSLLDTQSGKQSQVLAQQVESLAGGTPIAPGEVDRAREEMLQLEEKAKELLEENDRLRKEVREEEETLANMPTPEPETSTQKALRDSRQHREEKPKGIAEQILELHAGILSQMDELHRLRQDLKDNYVPISVVQNLDQCVRDTEADVLKVLSTNEYLEKTIQQLEADLEKIMEKTNTNPDDQRKIWNSINMLSAPPTAGED